MESSNRSVAIRLDAVNRSGAVERPRILMISSGFRSDVESTERVLALSEALTGDGWKTEVECCLGSPATETAGESDIRRLLSLAGCFRDLARMIPRFQIIHLAASNRASFLLFVLPALFLSKFLGKKVVLSFDLVTADEFLNQWGKLICPILKMADRLIVDSIYMASVLREYRLETDMAPVPARVQPDLFRPPGRPQPRILVDRPLEPSFNIGCLIRAFRFVKQKYPRAELIIAGTGSQRRNLESLVRSEAIHGVTFSGNANRSVVESLFANSDLYVVPSSVDSTPRSILRAFASGLPVVTTNAGGITGLVKDRVNGLVVPVGNHVVLAERIFELIENPELVTKLTLQAKVDAELFDWNVLGAAWRKMYRTIVRA